MKQIILRDYLISAMTVLFFALMIGLAIFSVRYKTKHFSGEAMSNDIVLLAQMFEQINKDCVILSFDYQKNNINFLNVRSFTGSEVGPMNLAHPDRWAGPYMEDNPTMQGKEYQIVRTKAGYFIVPGDGVQLPNGKIVGKEIILDEDADIASMADLTYNGKPLAALLSLSKTQPMLPGIEQASLIEF